jgi:hypothetical protein
VRINPTQLTSPVGAINARIPKTRDKRCRPGTQIQQRARLAIRLLRTNVGLFGNRSADKPKGDTMMDLFLRSVLGIVLGAALVFLMVWRRRRRSEH